MATKKYEFTLDRFNYGYTLTNYKDEDRNFKCTTPTAEQDKRIVEHLKGLVRLLNLDKLKVKIEIKN